MIKRWFAVILAISALGLALAGSLPQGSRFDAPVTIQTGPAGNPLSSVLAAAAQSVGLTPILREIPPVKVSVNLKNKPFRQVWNLLISTYGGGRLDYALLPNNIILVGPAVVVQANLPKKAPVIIATTPSVNKFYHVLGNPQTLAATLRKLLPGKSFSVEALATQKVLAINAEPQLQTQIAELISRIDQAPSAGPLKLHKVFRLNYANASNLVKELQQMVQAGSLGASPSTTRASQQTPPSQPASRLTINADPRTNSIIAFGTGTQLRALEQTIKQLDLPEQQVNIKVRIETVQSSFAQSLGIDWQGAIGNFSVGLVQDALSLIFNSTKSLATLNLGATLNALESQDLSKKLSDTNLTVLNNQQATLNSGGQLLIPITSSAAGVPSTLQSYPFGLTITVTPKITPDNTIELNLKTVIGDTPQTFGNGQILIPNQSSQSILRVTSGQTVVLGGLVQQKTSHNESGIPLLSWIPIVGNLFKTQSDNRSNTNLLIIITATIQKS